jgi:hypothetical protein
MTGTGGNDQPTGLNCPGCGQHAAMLVGDTAFCGNRAGCKILSWDITRTVNELAGKLHLIDAPFPPAPEEP